MTTLILAVVFLGEEIGWRGFLPLRLCELMPGRRAAVLTGACDAIFHVPLLILTTTYQYAGSRWIVAPTVTAIHRRSHRCRNRLSSIRCYAIVDRRRSVRGSRDGPASASPTPNEPDSRVGATASMGLASTSIATVMQKSRPAARAPTRAVAGRCTDGSGCRSGRCQRRAASGPCPPPCNARTRWQVRPGRSSR